MPGRTYDGSVNIKVGDTELTVYFNIESLYPGSIGFPDGQLCDYCKQRPAERVCSYEITDIVPQQGDRPFLRVAKRACEIVPEQLGHGRPHCEECRNQAGVLSQSEFELK